MSTKTTTTVARQLLEDSLVHALEGGSLTELVALHQKSVRTHLDAVFGKAASAKLAIGTPTPLVHATVDGERKTALSLWAAATNGFDFPVGDPDNGIGVRTGTTTSDTTLLDPLRSGDLETDDFVVLKTVSYSPFDRIAIELTTGDLFLVI